MEEFLRPDFVQEIVIICFTAFVGAFAGGIGAYLVSINYTRRSFRQARTFELVKDFFSQDMIHTRDRAFQAVKDVNPEEVRDSEGVTDLRHLVNHVIRTNGREAGLQLKSLLDFFTRAGALYETGAIENTLANDILGPHYHEWLGGYLRPYLKPDEPSPEWTNFYDKIRYLPVEGLTEP